MAAVEDEVKNDGSQQTNGRQREDGCGQETHAAEGENPGRGALGEAVSRDRAFYESEKSGAAKFKGVRKEGVKKAAKKEN